jgi:hypothetical protein
MTYQDRLRTDVRENHREKTVWLLSTALADLYKDDPVEIARWSSLFRMGAAFSSIGGAKTPFLARRFQNVTILSQDRLGTPIRKPQRKRRNGVAAGPLVSSVLAVRDLRLPYIASAVACVANLLLCSTIPETLAPAARRPFKWSSSSPLEVLKLFRNGKDLVSEYKRGVLVRFLVYIKRIILPRQARDKHRQSTQKDTV